jgi:CRP-like cAMP-binding protein
MSKITPSQTPPLTYADLLSRVSIFASLHPAQLSTLAAGAQKLRYQRGECFVEQGVADQTLYVVITGKASVVAWDTKGQDMILATLGPGDTIGEMSILDGKPSSANVVAEVQTDVLVLSQQALLQCLKNNHDAALCMMRNLVARLRKADEKIKSLGLLDVYDRVVRYLFELAVQNTDGRYEIASKVSKQTMAKHVGASREMVSKVFKNLEKTGVIILRPDGSLLLRDPSPGLYQPA